MGAMIAATVFFYAEAGSVTTHWKTSLHVGGLVTLVAAVHYMYMREYWVSVQKSPIAYRLLETLDWHCADAGLWLRWRDQDNQPMGWLRFGHVRLGIHSFRDLRW